MMLIFNRSGCRHVLLVLSSLVLFACGGGGSSSSGGTSGGATGGATGGSTDGSTGGSSDGSTGGASFDYAAMATNLADNVIIPNYTAFKNTVENQSSAEGAIGQYCTAIDSEDEASALAQARASWREMMDIWQQAEMHNFGPASEQASLLRNQVYSYDTAPFESCRTDRAVVLAEGDDFDIKSRTFDTRGLSALEYLLFEETLNHTCAETAPDNEQTADWNERSESERKLARCGYAQLVADDIFEAAQSIESEWLADGANYRETFISGLENSTEVVLGFISDAIFYIEKDSKDTKLATPLGIKDDACEAEACPETIESPYSQQSLNNIKANLEAFVSIFTGVDGLSFDDIIAEAGMTETNTAFLDDANAAIALIDSMLASETTLFLDAQNILDNSLSTECENSSVNPETTPTIASCSLHGYLKRITDRLRTDFVTIVGVDLPDRVQGDTD